MDILYDPTSVADSGDRVLAEHEELVMKRKRLNDKEKLQLAMRAMQIAVAVMEYSAWN